MENNIVGRIKERKLLHGILNSGKPEFLVVYGRRRVGKTYLVSEFFENKALFFEMTGSTKTTNEVHLQRFLSEASHTFKPATQTETLNNWDDSFMWLKTLIDDRMTSFPTENIVLFFDEIPWIENRDSGFLSALDYFWNKTISKSRYSRVKLIICGSAASWMIKRIIQDKGGLHNRVTDVIRLDPFTLAETEALLKQQGVQLNLPQITELYMALGGIPSYLIKVEPGLSSPQIINNLCFSTSAFLREEFEKLFSSLFDNYHNHVNVVRTLGKHTYGLPRGDLIKKTGLSNGGETTIILKELEESGFIQGRPHLSNRKKLRHYFLIDEYCNFFLRWIENSVSTAVNSIQNPWSAQWGTPAWHSWSGFAFESICFKHMPQIKKALGVSGVLTRETAFFHRATNNTKDTQGCQIDIVLQRSDKVTHLCEVKYYREELNISKLMRKQMSDKKRIYSEVSKTRDMLLTTLITANGAVKNENYLGIVDHEISLDDLYQESSVA